MGQIHGMDMDMKQEIGKEQTNIILLNHTWSFGQGPEERQVGKATEKKGHLWRIQYTTRKHY